MADLSESQSSGSTKIIGSDAAGVESNYTSVSAVGALGTQSEASLYAAAGQMFMTTSRGISSGSNTERAYFYFKNAAGNTKNVRIKQIVLSTPSSGNTLYKFYKNPTISVNGTVATIVGGRQTNQATAQTTAFILPTATANGTLFKSVNVPTGTSLILDFDFSIWVEPNNSILITSTQSLIGGVSGVDIDFVES